MGDVEPPELARLVDYAERLRHEGWSMRAALTRYAQPQPQRASDVIELMRRSDAGLRPHAKRLEREGTEVSRAFEAGDDDFVASVLRVMSALDGLGDALAAWAADPHAEARPDERVDDVVRDVGPRLDELGIPHEERPQPGPGGRPRSGPRRG